MVPLAAGYDRAEMIQPAVMSPPLNWLVSDAAGGVTGRRFLAVHWDPNLALEDAAAKSWGPGRLDRNRDNAHRTAAA
jgi:hypothetical protein